MNEKKWYPWFVVALLWFVAMLNYLDRQMLSTMQDAIKVDIAELRKAETFGALMAIFLYIYGFMSPVAGVIADKVNRKYLIVGSLFVWSAVTYLMGYAQTFQQLYWLRALMGVSEALYIPAGISLIADYHSDKTRSLAVGVHMTGLYCGSALGGLGATVAAKYTWHTTFHYFGLIGVAYAVVLLFFLREKKSRDGAEQGGEKQEAIPVFQGLGLLFSNISYWVILFYFAIPSLPGWATKNWLPTLFKQNLHIPMSEAGPLSTTTITLASLAGVLFGGFLSDRWIQRNIRGRIYTSALGLSLTIPALLLLGFGHSRLELVAAGVLFGVGFGMFDANNMPILCQFIPARLRATGYGLMNMVGVFCGAFITDLMGKSSDEGHLGNSFGYLSFIVAAAVILLLVTLRPKATVLEEKPAKN